MLAQSATCVLGAEQTAPLQLRDHQFREVPEPVGQSRRQDVEAVRSTGGEPVLQLVGNGLWRSHQRPVPTPSGYPLVEVADAQIFALMRGAGVNTVRVFTVPPVWLLGSSDYSARLAASRGLPYVFAHHFSGSGTAEALDAYARLFSTTG